MQMVFQDPTGSLDERLRVGAIAAEPLAIRGVGTRKDRRTCAACWLELEGTPPRRTTSTARSGCLDRSASSCRAFP